jgi:hypothetical protein
VEADGALGDPHRGARRQRPVEELLVQLRDRVALAELGGQLLQPVPCIVAVGRAASAVDEVSQCGGALSMFDVRVSAQSSEPPAYLGFEP